MASAKSRDLNLQRDDEALHSLLQEWMTQLSNRVKTRDQTDRAFAEMSESRTRGSDFSPSVPARAFYRLSTRRLARDFDQDERTRRH